MTTEIEIDEALEAAFGAALVLTGSRVAAERAVIESIASVEPDFGRATLLMGTAKAAIQQRRKFLDPPETPSTLPLELRALSLLTPVCRDCYVLRVLAGLGAEPCSDILNLSKDSVEAALHEAYLDLPRAIDSCNSGDQARWA